MAEAFASAYGSDILVCIAPAWLPPSASRRSPGSVLSEKNISSTGQFPKGLNAYAGEPYDVIVNLCGELSSPGVRRPG